MGGLILPPSLRVLSGANKPAPESSMVLVHKKSVAFLMRRADLAEAHAKALLEALDFAALENQLLVEALGRASGQWTDENTHTLDAFKRAFAQKYPGAPLSLEEIRNHQMRVTVEGIKRLPETPSNGA